MKFFLFIISFFWSTAIYGQTPSLLQQNEEILAFQYYQQGAYDKAYTLFEKLYKTDKKSHLFDYYFNTLIKIKKFDEAEKELKKLIKDQPNNRILGVSLGKLYLETDQKSLAEKTFNEVISSLPKDEFMIREIANSFYRIENYDLATKVFTEGRKLLNNETLFTFELISIYRFKKNKDFLVQEYIAILENMPEMIFQAQNGISSVFEDNEDYQILQRILLKKIQRSPDKEVYTDLLIWGYIQLGDYEMALRQLLAQDKRTKSDGTPILTAANTFTLNKAYSVSIKAYEYVVGKGKENSNYLKARLELINTKHLKLLSEDTPPQAFKELAEQYAGIINDYGQSINTLSASKKLAYLYAYYLNEPQKAISIMEKLITMPRVSANELSSIKLELADIYILNDEPWEAFLTYEQVARVNENSVNAHEANFKSARLSYFQGDFSYAKAKTDLLKSSTSQLIANDALNLSLLIADNLQNETDSLALKMYADAELLQFKNKIDLAFNKLDSISIKYPNNSLADDILMMKSKMHLEKNNYKLAVADLEALIINFSNSLWIDDALFTLGDLYDTQLKDSAKAMHYFQLLITDYPGSNFTAEARKRFRTLRGDTI